MRSVKNRYLLFTLFVCFFLQSWDVIEIQEETEDGSTVKSTIKIPMQVYITVLQGVLWPGFRSEKLFISQNMSEETQRELNSTPRCCA